MDSQTPSIVLSAILLPLTACILGFFIAMLIHKLTKTVKKLEDNYRLILEEMYKMKTSLEGEVNDVRSIASDLQINFLRINTSIEHIPCREEFKKPTENKRTPRKKSAAV